MRLQIFAASAAAIAMTLVAAAPAYSATQPQPGSFTGYAFDASSAPTQAEMDEWLMQSPFWGVGVYIAGDNRLDEVQANLTPEWVAAQAANGWRILPITVGRQPACSDVGTSKIDPDPTNAYAAAKAQGRVEANSTVNASQALGLGVGTTQWLDIEPFPIFETDDCRRSMLAFVSGWTRRLHALGYRSGFYSSAETGIKAIENARVLSPGSYTLPDQLWFAHFNDRANTDSDVLADGAWRHQRIHQYAGDVDVAYATTTLTIDRNWMDVGGGTSAPAPTPHCGVRVDFPSYAVLERGDTGSQVSALQCLLKREGLYDGELSGRYSVATKAAVRAFQQRYAFLADTGVTSKATWMVLLAKGPREFSKVGAGSNAVRRIQRALNAANGAGLTVSGEFDRPTEGAVKAYQTARGLTATGVVGPETWVLLQRGVR